DAGGSRYSPLTEIDRENVGHLRVAWTYRTSETVGEPGSYAHYAFEATPLMVEGTLFFSTPYNRVIALDAETGHKRWAWDAKVDRTLRWSWDPIPTRESDPARATWAGDSWRRTGAANVWSVMSVDAERGLVLLPSSSPSPDFYGGQRRGANVYANSVVALRAATGEVVWHFQVVHHDLWDYDVPAQPVLVTMPVEGKPVPAVE